MILTVDVEWPTGSESINIELEGTESPEEIAEIAQAAFFNVCNFGWSLDGVPQ